MASAKGQVGKAIISKLAKRSTAGAKKAVASKAKKAAKKTPLKAAISKAGASKGGKILKNAGNVIKSKATTLSGSRVKNAVNNTDSYRQLARTQTARKKVAAVAGAAAAGAAVGSKIKSDRKNSITIGGKTLRSKNIGKAKDAVASGKRKVAAGYKYVYGKLKRVGRSK